MRVKVTSGLPINWTDASDVTTKPLNYGWRTAFEAGERVLGTGFVRDARYHFSSVNPTVVNASPPHGENWLNELDYLTGGVGSKLIYDLNSDSLLTATDRVVDGGGAPVAGPTGIPVSVYQGPGLLSQPLLAILSAKLSTTIFNDNPYFSPNDKPAEPPAAEIDPGISGGHFDVDLYDAAGKVKHVHEYDDKYNVTGVNFLAASNSDLNIENVISGTGTKFKILIANQKMSPSVEFSYGGLPFLPVVDIPAYTTAGLSMASLSVFKRDDVKTLKYKMPKDAFESKKWVSGDIKRSGLMPSQTGCVQKGPDPDKDERTGTSGPAPDGLHRNGALTFQLVKDTTPDSALTMASNNGDADYGYRIKVADRAAYLLAEWTVFWHHDNKFCFGVAGWVPDPPQDTVPSKKEPLTPDPGAADPPYDEWGEPVSTVVVTEPNPDNPSLDIRTTTLTYANGIKVIIDAYLNADGKVEKVIITTVVPSGGGGGGPPIGGGISQALSAANTITGYQQTRSAGKLGRVSWHELLAP